MVNKNHLDQDCRQKAREILLKKHRHQCKTKSSKKGKTSIGSFGSFAKKASSAGLSEMLKRSDSTPKSAEQQKLEVVNEVDQKGEFPHLPSAVDLVGKQKDSNAKEEIEMSNAEVCVEVKNWCLFANQTRNCISIMINSRNINVSCFEEGPEGGGFQSHFPAHIFYKSHFPVLKNIYLIPILKFLPIASVQIPVPVPSIPFSQGNKRPIPAPILPLQDPL